MSAYDSPPCLFRGGQRGWYARVGTYSSIGVILLHVSELAGVVRVERTHDRVKAGYVPVSSHA